MKTKRNNFAACSLAMMLMISAITPCFAAEAAAASSPGAGMDTASNSADFIPLERTQAQINGEMVIEEIYEVDAAMDPQSLVRKGFEMDGFYYTENSIVKTPYTESREKEVEQEFRVSAPSANLADNIGLLPATIEYDEDGFAGTLYLNPQSVAINVSAREAKSSTTRKTKTYTLETNDPDLVPSIYEGLPRTSLSWDVSGFIEDSSIPAGYVATAVYSKSSSYTVASAWELSATYSGDVKYENTSLIRYAVTYKGIEKPAGTHVSDGYLIPDGYALTEDGYLVKGDGDPLAANLVDGVLIPDGYTLKDSGKLAKTSHTGTILTILGTLLIAALVAGAALFLLWALKHGLLASQKLKVQAQDDSSGEYTLIQKSKINKKSPTLTIDTLKMPAARHFLCELPARRAKVLRGKILHVFADGQEVAKHKIEPISDTEAYIFSVDLERVDSGPADTFSL